MNAPRPIHLVIFAFTCAACATSAAAKDKPKPALSIDPVAARTLLAPVEVDRPARPEAPSYRVGDVADQATGKRAKLSVPIGDTTLFAIGGKLTRRQRPGPPNLPADAFSSRKDSGKVYGAGVERRIGPVDLSATYQYSKVTAEHPDIEGAARISSGERSHSLRATARIRFRN